MIKTKISPINPHLLIPFIFIIFVLYIIPIQQNFEFDPDEGINLMKAFLYSKGFSLYQEIWNDQPPLFTVILSSWLNLFGQSVFAARILTLLFSALLVWSFYQILYIQLGLSAVIGTLLLVTSRKFIQLSVSVMIGIPSLSLAMLSIYTLTLYKQKHQQRLLIISGILLALSLQTKFFTVFLIPILLIYLWTNQVKQPQVNPLKSKFTTISIWLFSILSVYILIGIIFHSLNYQQLFKPHIEPSIKSGFKDYQISYDSLNVLGKMINKDYDIALLAVLGILIIFVWRQSQGYLPLAWLGVAILLLMNYQPVWYHHYTLISIPLAWLAAYGSSNFNFKQLKVRNIFGILAIGLLILSLARLEPKITELSRTVRIKEPHHDINVVNLLLKYKQSTQWVFTDRPIYAFYAGLPVPPEVAVFSQKRFRSGNLSYEQLLLILQKYLPEQIIISRYKQKIEEDHNIKNYLNEKYVKVYQTDVVDYFVLIVR